MNHHHYNYGKLIFNGKINYFYGKTFLFSMDVPTPRLWKRSLRPPAFPGDLETPAKRATAPGATAAFLRCIAR
jgi:hypothetical protein